MPRKVKDFKNPAEALRFAGREIRECEHCAEEYVGRADARFCSDRCRQAARRENER